MPGAAALPRMSGCASRPARGGCTPLRQRPRRSRSTPVLAAACQTGDHNIEMEAATDAGDSMSRLGTASSWAPGAAASPLGNGGKARGLAARSPSAASSVALLPRTPCRLPEIVPNPWGRGPQFAPTTPGAGLGALASATPSAASKTTSASERRRWAELLLDIGKMEQENAENLAAQIQEVADFHEGEKLRRAFRTRAAELLSMMPLQQLQLAHELLVLVQKMDSELLFELWSRSDTWPPTAGTKPTRWQCPTRALEERLAHLTLKGAHSLQTLSKCHIASSKLVVEGLVRPKVHELTLHTLLRWIEREPLQLLQRNAPLLKELADSQRCVLEALEHRILRRSLQPFRAGQLSGFAHLVLHLQDAGLEILDGPGAPQLDAPSCEHYPPLQISIMNSLRRAVKDLPISRLAADFRGPLLQLITARKGISDNVQLVVTDRVSDELHIIRNKVMKRDDPVRVQEELSHWGRFTEATGGAGLLDLCEPIRAHLLGPPEEIGSLAFCAATCTPGSKEFPPEYLGRKEALHQHLEEVWHMVTRVFALLGDAQEVAVAQRLLNERSVA